MNKVSKVKRNNHFLNKLKNFFMIPLIFLVAGQTPSGNLQNSVSDSFRFDEQDITKIRLGYSNGTFTVRELVQAYLDRINEIDKNGPGLNSIIQINPDAIQIAEVLDDEMKSHPLPKQRKEFEDRAQLYALLRRIEEFIELKVEFAQIQLRNKQI